jgi:hypothetical protein
MGFRPESTVGFLIAKLILASGIEEEMDIKNNVVFDEPYGGCWPGIQKLTERATYLALIVFILTNPLDTHAQTWSPVTSKEKLTQIFSDTTFRATLKGGVKATAHYDADGTGELDAWGDTYAREWKIEGNDQVCVKIDKAFQCFRFEQNPETDNEYRATNVITGESIVISVMPQGTTEVDATIAATGGPAQPSAEEMAAKLSNPTSPVMTIGNNFDYVTFKGDLPGSEDESSFRYVFQTTFPLKLKNGGSVFFRPAIPVFFNEPVPTAWVDSVPKVRTWETRALTCRTALPRLEACSGELEWSEQFRPAAMTSWVRTFGDLVRKYCSAHSVNGALWAGYWRINGI